jgi:hypothetical protein
MKRLLLALLLATGCSAPHSFPQKIERPYTDPAPHEEQAPSVCHITNDCPVSMICKVATGQCVECLNEDQCPLGETCSAQNTCITVTPPSDPDHGDPYIPGDPNPGDPVEPPGDPTLPPDECTVGECTPDGDYYLCEVDGDIPIDNPYCDYYTYEGCPDYMTPFLVTWSDGWEDCICIEECQWTS